MCLGVSDRRCCARTVHIPPERLLTQRDLRGHGDAHLLLREVVEVNCVAAIDMRQARAPRAVEKVQQALEIEDDRGSGRGLFEYAPFAPTITG